MWAEKFPATPPQNGRFWGCRNFCKIAFLGLISAVFDSDRPTESQNGSSVTKNFLRRLWNPFGAGRKFFDHPTPKRSILGVQKFLPSLFRPFLFKKIFLIIFSVSKESYLERTDACWGVNLFQKCLIIRSKGLGSLWIEFGDRLLKLEKWSNSSNFVKLTVNSMVTSSPFFTQTCLFYTCAQTEVFQETHFPDRWHFSKTIIAPFSKFSNDFTDLFPRSLQESTPVRRPWLKRHVSRNSSPWQKALSQNLHCLLFKGLNWFHWPFVRQV